MTDLTRSLQGLVFTCYPKAAPLLPAVSLLPVPHSYFPV